MFEASISRRSTQRAPTAHDWQCRFHHVHQSMAWSSAIISSVDRVAPSARMSTTGPTDMLIEVLHLNEFFPRLLISLCQGSRVARTGTPESTGDVVLRA